MENNDISCWGIVFEGRTEFGTLATLHQDRNAEVALHQAETFGVPY